MKPLFVFISVTQLERSGRGCSFLVCMCMCMLSGGGGEGDLPMIFSVLE